MDEAKSKDLRIDIIELSSMGWVWVLDKDGTPIKELCGAWTSKLAVHLENIAPETTSFRHWRELPFSDHLFEADSRKVAEMIIDNRDLKDGSEFRCAEVVDKERDEYFSKLLNYWKNHER